MSNAASDALAYLHDVNGRYRIAIVHDWLVVQGGAEKVLDALLEAFPGAEVYTLVDFLPEEKRGRLAQHRVHKSLIQRLPLARRHYRHYLPLMPFAIEQFDLRGFDLVLSSSHAVAKGVITHPDQMHLCYCHTPVRYAWDMKEGYLQDAALWPVLEWFVRRTLKRLRQWDHFTASQVDHFLANSHNVARRIRKFYGRRAAVLPPPVDIDAFTLNTQPREDYYLAASRLVPYKRLDLIVEAFRRDGRRKLKVVGDGPERKRLERLAAGCPNIELLGYQSHEALHTLMARARGFIFAADEDFGIVPLEAQACGTPVIAFGKGGALETVLGSAEANAAGRATGIFFDEQSSTSLLDAVSRFERLTFDPLACRRQAEAFSRANFMLRLQQQLADLLMLPVEHEGIPCT